MMAIPAVDLSCLRSGSPAEREETLRAFVESCATYGFVKVTGHGIPEARLHELFLWVG